MERRLAPPDVGRRPVRPVDDPQPVQSGERAARRQLCRRCRPEGAAMVFFTDGLVEGRDMSIEAGMDRLQHQAAAADDPARHLLAGIAAGQRDDEVALLVLRRRADSACADRIEGAVGAGGPTL